MRAVHLSMDRRRRYWDGHAGSCDRQMQFAERYFLGDSRAWVCSQATGQTLEVAIGTGLNLTFYPAEVELAGVEVELAGVDFSPAMLAQARRRAAEVGFAVDLREADALQATRRAARRQNAAHCRRGDGRPPGPGTPQARAGHCSSDSE